MSRTETEIKENTLPQEGSSLSLEQSFETLDTMIRKLEAADTTLDESFAVYQEGMKLLKLCNDKIDTVEKKMLVISEEGHTDEF